MLADDRRSWQLGADAAWRRTEEIIAAAGHARHVRHAQGAGAGAARRRSRAAPPGLAGRFAGPAGLGRERTKGEPAGIELELKYRVATPTRPPGWRAADAGAFRAPGRPRRPGRGPLPRHGGRRARPGRATRSGFAAARRRRSSRSSLDDPADRALHRREELEGPGRPLARPARLALVAGPLARPGACRRAPSASSSRSASSAGRGRSPTRRPRWSCRSTRWTVVAAGGDRSVPRARGRADARATRPASTRSRPSSPADPDLVPITPRSSSARSAALGRGAGGRRAARSARDGPTTASRLTPRRRARATRPAPVAPERPPAEAPAEGAARRPPLVVGKTPGRHAPTTSSPRPAARSSGSTSPGCWPARPGPATGSEIEDLHGMRVATRRMRAAWRVFGDGFRPDRTRAHARPAARRRRAARRRPRPRRPARGRRGVPGTLPAGRGGGLRAAGRTPGATSARSPGCSCCASWIQRAIAASSRTTGSSSRPRARPSWRPPARSPPPRPRHRRLADLAGLRAGPGVRMRPPLGRHRDRPPAPDRRPSGCATRWSSSARRSAPRSTSSSRGSSRCRTTWAGSTTPMSRSPSTRQFLVANAGRLRARRREVIAAYLAGRERELARLRRTMGVPWRGVSGVPVPAPPREGGLRPLTDRRRPGGRARRPAAAAPGSGAPAVGQGVEAIAPAAPARASARTTPSRIPSSDGGAALDPVALHERLEDRRARRQEPARLAGSRTGQPRPRPAPRQRPECGGEPAGVRARSCSAAG